MLLSYRVYESLGYVVQPLQDSMQGQEKVKVFPRFWLLPKFPPMHGHPALRGQLFPKLGAGNMLSTLNSYMEKRNAHDHSLGYNVGNMLTILNQLYKMEISYMDTYEDHRLPVETVVLG